MAAFEVRQLAGRGQGLVAARDLAAGEEVLADSPLLTLAPGTTPAGGAFEQVFMTSALRGSGVDELRQYLFDR